MSTMNSDKMEKALYAMVECLAGNYGFDADAAFEFVRWETDVDHVGEILKMVGGSPAKKETKVVKDDASEAPSTSSGGDVAEKIATCRKNISLWEKKLADGKVKDADKQSEKIAKERAKLLKLEAKAPSNPAPVKEEKKVETKVETKVEKEKRIKRFSPTMASQLKSALEGVGLEMNDKIKKEFQQYIEDLSEDDYRNSGLGDHMRAFAKSKAPVSAAAESSEDEEETPAVPPPAKEEKKEIPAEVSGGAGVVTHLELDDLRAIKTIAAVNPVGNFWDADNGRFVTGPDADEDEDFVETKFNGTEYVVGEKTGRVYEARESGDVFMGFCGVGKFKGMKMP